MKLLKHPAIVISTLLLLPAVSLHAQDKPLAIRTDDTGSDIYLKAEAGGVYMQDLQVHVNTREEFKFNPGTRGDVIVGYNFSRSWSTELDFGVLWNSIDKYGAYSFDASKADLFEIPIMVNYLYRLPIKRSFEAYVGGGIGAVIGILHIDDQGLDFKDTDVTFGGQAMAGLSYHLSRLVDLSLAYKFLATTDHKWSDQDFYTKTAGTMAHAVLLGVSIKY